MERFVCIHGHFYQPPRENPWLEAVEIQDSSFPYHDWNERITAECYAPNCAARILDPSCRITGIVSNYARISFNFGPTLLSWMEKSAPDTYQAVLEADRLSIAWRSGHGAALAQVYNHLIMPLATLRDKRTQVRWGIRDFQRRFKRVPEGMWLAETAVDTETLEVLAQEGIRFTVLAPHQAARVRRLGEGGWREVTGARVDPSRAYLCRLPSGRTLSIFFYDGPISQAVAFEGLLDNGERFASRLMSGFSPLRRHPQLVHIATDGETYGHHHRFGDMALGHALNHIEDNGWARLTNYGEFLALHPAGHEVQIVEHSSWSCLHGIERWRSDCGCNSGGHAGWNQLWRRPLREALDWLGGELASCFEREAAGYLKDPWEARDDYLEVIADRSEDNVAGFLLRHALRPLDDAAGVTVLCLLEMQRHALLMFTSCGWFFDEPSGLETVQILQYAGRALQLAQRCGCQEIEAAFLERLALARSNIAEQGDLAAVYRRFVLPATIDLIRVAAHYAVSSVFEEYGEETGIFSYRAFREDFLSLGAGAMKLSVGRIYVSSSITRKSDRVSFCTLHFGGHALNCGCRSFLGEEAYLAMKEEVTGAFQQADYAAIIRLMDAHFGMHNYSLRDLFRDEQRSILRLITAGSLQELDQDFAALYDKNRVLMGFLKETGMPVPRRFMSCAEGALNLRLLEIFAAPEFDAAGIGETVAELKGWDIELDTVTLEFTLRRRVEGAMAALVADPGDPGLLSRLLQLMEALEPFPWVNLWLTQNMFWELLNSGAWRVPVPPSEGDGLWRRESLEKLASLLSFNLPAGLALPGGEP